MKKNEFNKRVKEALSAINYGELESFADEFARQGINRVNVFAYAAASENYFEKMCSHSGYTRKTTYSSDFAIAEWYAGVEGVEKTVFDTFKKAVKEWCDDVEYFAEIILAVNVKSWEHAQRGNHEWSKLYAELYYAAKDLYFDWFDKTHAEHDEAMRYYFDYVD